MFALFFSLRPNNGHCVSANNSFWSAGGAARSKTDEHERDEMAAAPPPAAAGGSNAHFSDLLRALWAPGPRWPSALVIWPILLKVELIERIDLLRVGRHSPNNYLTFAAVTHEMSGSFCSRPPPPPSLVGRRVGAQKTPVLQKEKKSKVGLRAALRAELCRCATLCP